MPDLVNGLVRMAAESPDGPPVWPLQGVETGCMIGYHSAVVLAEAQAKGFKGIDYARACLPGELDHGRTFGAIHLDAMRDQACIEEPVGGQRAAQCIARGVVLAVVERLPLEVIDVALGAPDRGDGRGRLVELEVHGRNGDR